jgi:hypothetical protein
MNDFRNVGLSARLTVCSHTIRALLSEIKEIEFDAKMSVNDKLDKIKIIREEISKVGMEIDSIKKEIILIHAYKIN